MARRFARPGLRTALPLILLLAATAAHAESRVRPTLSAVAAADTFSSLTWVPGSSYKVEQIIGDHDWQFPGVTVRSRTLTNADVLGNGQGFSFLSGDSLLLLFGDTIGATPPYVPRWASVVDSFKWQAMDPIASCRTKNPDSLLLLKFYMKNADTTLTVAPIYSSGQALDMGPDDVPACGLDLDSRLYLICSTGTVTNPDSTSADHSGDSSVVVRFDPVAKTFTAGRTMSRAAQGGHFILCDPHELPMQFADSPTDSEVLVFGAGAYRASDVYLSKITKARFESGVNAQGHPVTRYFTGLVGGNPTWSDSESAAVPIVFDDPLTEIGVGVPQMPWPNDQPTIGNLSVAWFPTLQLWLMTFDGGRQEPPRTYLSQTTGVYFTYAKAPWGPWIVPQQIYNGTRDGGFGTFIHRLDSTGGAGPAGPTIGSQKTNNPDSTNGGTFAPEILEPFVRIRGDTLLLDYNLSTWNPYTVVRMRSKFLITPGQSLAVPVAPLPALRLEVAPNPFDELAHLEFALPGRAAVDLSIFDPAGRRIRTLAHATLAAGSHDLSWNGTDESGARVQSGLYFARLEAGDRTVIRRLVRLR